MEPVYDKQALVDLVQEHALEFGQFTLASGKQASFYLDCRKVTLHSEGARQVGEGILELLGDAVGGGRRDTVGSFWSRWLVHARYCQPDCCYSLRDSTYG